MILAVIPTLAYLDPCARQRYLSSHAEIADRTPATETKPQPLQLGRADALNARSQQVLEVVGILDELLAQGLKCNSKSSDVI